MDGEKGHAPLHVSPSLNDEDNLKYGVSETRDPIHVSYRPTRPQSMTFPSFVDKCDRLSTL
jgi:hypothetical protein